MEKILTPDYIIDSGEFQSTLGNSNQPAQLSPKSDKEVKVLINHMGKVKSILSDSFALLQFHSNDKIEYCLFDTYDFYVEENKSAAQLKLKVREIVEVDFTVNFHACEISPGSIVPWLATGIWRSEITNIPKPVPFCNISKEKLSVFKKVASACCTFLADEVASISTSEVAIREVEASTSHKSAQNVTNTKLVNKDVEKDRCDDACDSVLRTGMKNKDSSVLDDSGAQRLPSESSLRVKNEFGCDDEPHPSTDTTDNGQAVTCRKASGTVVKVYDDEFALIRMDDPSGCLALLHRSRLFKAEDFDWDNSSNSVKKLEVFVRPLLDVEEFAYQVHYAYVASLATGVEYGPNAALKEFISDKLGMEALTAELNLFKAS